MNNDDNLMDSIFGIELISQNKYDIFNLISCDNSNCSLYINECRISNSEDPESVVFSRVQKITIIEE